MRCKSRILKFTREHKASLGNTFNFVAVERRNISNLARDPIVLGSCFNPVPTNLMLGDPKAWRLN